MPSLTAHLKDLVDQTARSLPGVSWKRMFGCDAAFVDGQIFALIWKDGRIGLKLPSPERFGELMATEGASPWSPGKMNPMSKWVLAPEAFHDDEATLAGWVREAHAEVAATAGAPKPQKQKAAAPAKKRAPAKPAPRAAKRPATKR